MSALWTVCVCARACVCEVEQTVYVLFNRTSSMLMNVQPGDRCVKLCRMFLSCRTLFHTCTGMTWSRYIIDTRGEIYENKIWICMLNTSFSFLSFVSVFDQDISAFEKLLNCIRQEGKSFLRGRLPLRVKLESAGPQTET